jgi:hypothetical protein
MIGAFWFVERLRGASAPHVGGTAQIERRMSERRRDAG